VVLVRSDGNAMYVAKDIGYHLWKVGRLSGMAFRAFDAQPTGHVLWTTHPQGEPEAEGHDFGHAQQAVNVIDVRQAHPQAIVRAALELTRAASGEGSGATGGTAKVGDADEAVLHHLAYEVVTLEGQAMSGRKGVTLAIDAVLEEAVRRARAVVADKQPDLHAIDEVARAVGVGALRFAMLKSEAKRVIDFRWEQALSLAGDSAPYVQYAHARADSILRAAEEAAANAGAAGAPADWDALGPLEVKLAQLIARYPEVVRNAAHDDAPHVVAQYALDLATAWNGYYNHRGPDGRPDTAVLRAESGLREARLALVAKVRDTLARTLSLLGVEAPRQM
jgi:arginyl-tRNA synthetase